MNNLAFRHYSWVRLVSTLLEFKKSMAKVSKKAGWNKDRWQEVCEEIRYIQGIMEDVNAPHAERQAVMYRLLDAACKSRKILIENEPNGVEGSVCAFHEDILLPSGELLVLPHVSFRTKDGHGEMRHRLEEIKLTTEAWWFSYVQHKSSKI